MKRTSADVQDDGQEGHQGTLPQAKVARVDNEEAAGEGSSAGSLLESVGDDVLMLIMDWCGLEASVRAFFLSNHHLRGLLCRHQGLWRRAYEELFKLPESKDKKSSLRRAPKKEPLPPPPVDDYFVAYTEAMRKWTGAFDFEEDDVPLAEDDGEVVVKVDIFGRATWEGYGIGCGRAGEYTSLHCLAGRGKLVLAYKKGQLTAKVVGWERSEDDDCERGYYDDDDEDDDEDEDEDEEVDAKEKEKRQKEKEELKKKKEEAENYPAQWVKTTLAQLRASSTFYSSVTYRLHLDSPRKGYRGKCTGGSACRSWHEDMEW